MKDFWDDLIAYIKEYLNNDTSIGKQVKVNYANAQIKIDSPHIFIMPMQDSDAEQYDSFGEGENISYCEVQIMPYCQQMKINNVLTSAQEVSLIFADKISDLFDKATILTRNPNIVRLRRVGETFAMPVEKGATTYVSPLRYEFYVQKKYKKIYKE